VSCHQRRLHPTVCTAIAVLSCLGSTAELPAQYFNRAAFGGVEDEGFRRDFAIGNEYFLDRFSVVVPPPWWQRGLPWFADRFEYRLGSTSSTQFTLEGAYDQRFALDKTAGIGVHLLHSENRDWRFLRQALELDLLTSASTGLFVQAEPSAEKAEIDVSAGAWLWRAGDQGLRLMWTGVDLTSEKSRSFEYRRAAHAVMLTGAHGRGEDWRITWELGGQLPFQVEELATQESLRMERWIGSAEAHWRLAAQDWLVAAAELEWTRKEMRPAAVGGASTEDFDREFRQFRLEYWRDQPDRSWSVGVLHTNMAEDALRPFDPAGGQHGRRQEWFGIARLQLPIDGRLSFEPQVFAGYVSNRQDGAERQRHQRFEGKAAWNLRWDFSPHTTLVLVVSTQLDQWAFGGGGAQFSMRF